MSDAKDFKIRDSAYGSHTLEEYVGPGGDVIIPEGVTDIGNAFHNAPTNITSITLPKTLKRIRNGYTFCGLRNLTTFHIHPQNEHFHMQNGCLICVDSYNRMGETVKEIVWGSSDATIPDDVTRIGEGAFADRYSQNSVSIPSSVTEIGEGAFRRASLQTVILPKSVRYVGQDAFSDCDNLTEVRCPSKCTVGRYAFSGCKKLKYATVSAHIGWWAFRGAENLISVTIVHGAENNQDDSAVTGGYVPQIDVDKEAFEGCSKLEMLHVSQPEVFRELLPKYKQMAMVGFAYRYVDKRVTEEENETYFAYTKRNRKKILAERYQHLPVYLYMAEKKLIDVSEIDGLVADIKSAEIKAFLIDYKSRELTPEKQAELERAEEKKIEKLFSDAPKTLADWKEDWSFSKLEDGTYRITAYKGTALDVVVPSDIMGVAVTEISSKAFSPTSTKFGADVVKTRKAITHVTISEGVKIIGDNAFFACAALECVDIPSTVCEIGKKAFAECTALKSVVIPSKVQRISDGAFLNCKNLTDLQICEGVKVIGSMTFESCSALKTLVVPNGVTTLEYRAFNFCTRLTNVTLPASVKFITSTFYNCSKKLVIHAPTYSYAQKYAKGQKIIFQTTDNPETEQDKLQLVPFEENWSFEVEEDGSFSIVKYKGESTDVVIPNGFKKITATIFEKRSDVVSVTISADVATLDIRAFYMCDQLERIEVDENNPNYRSIDGNLYSKDGTALLVYAKGKTAQSFVVPDSVTSIGGDVFSWCPFLTSFTIPDSVISIHEMAFGRSLSPKQAKALTICTNKGSYAEKFAKEKQMNVEYIEE